MTKVIRSQDCGNSPKNKFVEDVEIAFAQSNHDFLLSAMTPDVHWRIVGEKAAHGTKELLETLRGVTETIEIFIQHVMSHGKTGSVNGIYKHKDGKVYEFCTVYVFDNAKGTRIKEVIHYKLESDLNSIKSTQWLYSYQEGKPC